MSWSVLSGARQSRPQIRQKCFASIGDAALIGFEWCQRESDAIGTIAWSHYEPGRRAKVRQHKTGAWVWLPLRDADGPYFPELEVLAQLRDRQVFRHIEDQSQQLVADRGEGLAARAAMRDCHAVAELAARGIQRVPDVVAHG